MESVLIGDKEENYIVLQADRIALTAPGLSAFSGFYVDATSGFFHSEFFETLNQQWKGWEGELTWRSLEGELTLVATHERSGHISITALISDRKPSTWEASCTVQVLAGEELSRIVEETKQLFTNETRSR